MKKWLIGIAVMLLAAGGVMFTFHLRGKARLAEKIAELKSQGLPTTFAELEAKYKLPEGASNAADIYKKAILVYKPLPNTEKQKMLPILGQFGLAEENEPYSSQQMDAMKEFITQNKEMFALVHEAGAIGNCYYPVRYSIDPLFMDKTVMNIKILNQSLMVAGIYYSLTNQKQEAYDVVIDHLRLSHSLSKNPSQLGHLIRMAILAAGISDIREIINRISLDQTYLEQMQYHAQQVSQSATMKPFLLGEICDCIENQRVPSTIYKDGLVHYIANLFPANIVTQINAYQQIIEFDKLPIHEQLPKIQKVCDVKFLCFLPQIELSVTKHVCSIHFRVRAEMDCAITALAIERYRLKEGKLPETAEALVPGYLPQVYVDPFDGNPLRYKQMDTGYMIYTIGSDGVDNGGRERGPNERGENLDWVFRVYR